jgi:hypothetical protein
MSKSKTFSFYVYVIDKKDIAKIPDVNAYGFGFIEVPSETKILEFEKIMKKRIPGAKFFGIKRKGKTNYWIFLAKKYAVVLEQITK